MAATSLPSIHEMFPDHLMTTDYKQPRSSKTSSSYHKSHPPSSQSVCTTPGCNCTEASSSSPTPARSNRVYHRPASHSAPLSSKSADPSLKSMNKECHPSPYSFEQLRPDPSNSTPLAVNDRRRTTGPDDFLPHAQSVSTSPYMTPHHYTDYRANGKLPFGVDGSRSQRLNNPHPQDPYRLRSLSSSEVTHPHPSDRSYPPYHTNGANHLEPDFEDDDGSVGKSMGSVDGSMNLDALGRKHVCPTCFKRFNRPSSLRIHLNTHTGATPFKCPWPKCGREFNVNSNMRRHYRNHLSIPRGQGQYSPPESGNELRSLAPAPMHPQTSHQGYPEDPQSSKGDYSRIRHRRENESDLSTNRGDNESRNRPQPHHSHQSGFRHENAYARETMPPDFDYQSQRKYKPLPSPPSSGSSLSDDGLSTEIDEARDKSSRFRADPAALSKIRRSSDVGRRSVGAFSASPSISHASSVPSRLSTPTDIEVYPEQQFQPKYNASKPYSASLKDARVRTTLRPAFK